MYFYWDDYIKTYGMGVSCSMRGINEKFGRFNLDGCKERITCEILA
jgi:hypothetical protein